MAIAMEPLAERLIEGVGPKSGGRKEELWVDFCENGIVAEEAVTFRGARRRGTSLGSTGTPSREYCGAGAGGDK